MAEFDSVWSVMSQLGDFNGYSGAKTFDRNKVILVDDGRPSTTFVISTEINQKYVIDGGIVYSNYEPNPNVPIVVMRNIPGYEDKHQVIVRPEFREEYKAFMDNPDQKSYLLPYKIRLSRLGVDRTLSSSLMQQKLYIAANSNMNFVKQSNGKVLMYTKVSGAAYIPTPEIEAFNAKTFPWQIKIMYDKIAMMNELRLKHCSENEPYVEQKSWKCDMRCMVDKGPPPDTQIPSSDAQPPPMTQNVQLSST